VTVWGSKNREPFKQIENQTKQMRDRMGEVRFAYSLPSIKCEDESTLSDFCYCECVPHLHIMITGHRQINGSQIAT
jgi:hypothetical protein